MIMELRLFSNPQTNRILAYSKFPAFFENYMFNFPALCSRCGLHVFDETFDWSIVLSLVHTKSDVNCDVNLTATN